jgi:uncharacterized protein (DUF608 family)
MPADRTASSSSSWPVLTRYDQRHLARIALPLGGIGTGTVSLGGYGDLRDWEIMNRPAKGYFPGGGRTAPFFALYAKQPGATPIARALQGMLPEDVYEGAMGAAIPNHGLPRFRRCLFEAAYPLGQVVLSDPDVPLSVRLQAFNPLVPCDADASGIPVAVLRYVLTNRTNQPVEAAICGMLVNFIGNDGAVTGPQKGNRNEFRRGKGLHGVFLFSSELDPKRSQWGTMALSVVGQRDASVTYRTAWAERGWGESLLDFWEDFAADGRIEDREPGGAAEPKASLAARVTVPPRGTKALTFLVTWHFPNREIWFPPQPAPDGSAPGDETRVGNHYATLYRDAWDVAEKTAAGLSSLEARTLCFVRAFCESDLPNVVKDAALATLTALRSQTTFRTADGFPFGWEGCSDRCGCCQGSCTHVWNYENAVGFLFGEFSRLMRRVEFEYATDDRGLMCFRIGLPLKTQALQWPKAAADGQMGAIMRCYRDWKLSGDDVFLRRLWPKVRRALEFCWVEGGWDADRDGVMEGCQHNTMDVEYFGPNPQMGIWYLGALRATEEMAQAMGETGFAHTCRSLFERGRGWIETNLFNGEFYEHKIQPPRGPIAEGLTVGMGAKNLAEPEFQLGPGCLVDQLVGQYMAHAMGLGYLTEPAQVRKTLQSIMKYNFQKGFQGHFNPMRSYVLNDEAALLMASYPHGNRPRSAFPYFTEVMTGFEYTAAIGMLYEGLTTDGLKCIKAIRDRYDGRKRSPFNEAECGHHYARAMASWTAVLALTGFQYDGVTQVMQFAASRKTVTWFWSNGSAWGTLRQTPGKQGIRLALSVLHGRLAVRRLVLEGYGEVTVPSGSVAAGRTVMALCRRAASGTT